MFWWLAENTLIAALLALLVGLGCRLGRVSPVIRHALWLVVLIRLIAPPIITVSLPASTKTQNTSDNGRVDSAAEIGPLADLHGAASCPEDLRPIQTLEPDGDLAATFAEEPEILVSSEELRVPSVPKLAPRDSDHGESAIPVGRPAPDGEVAALPSRTPGFTAYVVGLASAQLIWIALAGTLVTAFVQGVRIARIWQMLKQSRPAGAEVTTMVQRVAAMMKLRAPEVRLSPHIRSPFICALGRAVLLWPEAMTGDIPAIGCRAVVVHELAHVARRDHFVGWLELFAGCLWWWNPLFWYVRHQLRENAELACDAWVVGLFPEARRFYARALIDLAEFDSVQRPIAPALGVGALGAGKGSRNLFERRLVMIMRGHGRYRLGAGGIMGIGLLALAVLPGCSASQASAEPLTTGTATIATDDPFAPPRLSGSVGGGSQQAEDDPFVQPAADPSSQKGPTPQVPAPTTQEGPPAAIGTVPVLENDGNKPRSSGLRSVAEVTPPTVSNEDRIKRLEDRLEAILTELRTMKNPPAGKGPPSNPAPILPSATASEKSKALHPSSDSQSQPGLFSAKQHKRELVSSTKFGDVETTTLTRATYKLPAGRAQAVAAFLMENLTDEIEVRMKENALQVTANSEDQARIAQFIQLLQMRGTPAPKPSAPRTEPSSDTKRDNDTGLGLPATRETNANPFEEIAAPAGLQKR